LSRNCQNFPIFSAKTFLEYWTLEQISTSWSVVEFLLPPGTSGQGPDDELPVEDFIHIYFLIKNIYIWANAFSRFFNTRPLHTYV
jgi:hypothetical protein